MTNTIDNLTEVAENLKVKQEGDLLIIVIDLSVTPKPSESGKMSSLASTGGFTPLPIKTPAGKFVKASLYVGISNK